MMTRVKVMQAAPGMVVGKDVIDRNGRVLVRAGSVLNPKHLKIFKSWGVAELMVTKTGKTPPSPKGKSQETSLIPDTLDSPLEKKIAHRFRFADLRHPAIRELFDVVLQREQGHES